MSNKKALDATTKHMQKIHNINKDINRIQQELKTEKVENKAIQAVTGLELANMQRTRPTPVLRGTKNTKVKANRKQVEEKRKLGNKNSMYNKYKRQLSRYYASLLDPWAELDAKYPEPCAYPSTPFKISFPIQIKTGPVSALPSSTEGRAAFILRDGITKCLSVSNDGSGTSTMAYDSSHGGWYINGANWVQTPEAAAIRSTFSAYRVVSMGVKFVYTAAPVNASGKVAVALFPPSYTLPNDALLTNLNWQDLSQFQGAQTYSAIEGFVCVWKPFSTYGMADYRPLNNVFFKNGYSFNSSWDIDVQELVVGYISSYLAEIGVAISNGAGNAVAGKYGDNHSDSLIGTMLNFTLPSQSPAIMIMWEGCPADTVIGNVEVVVNIEGIADNRTFSLAQALNPDRVAGTSAEAERAIAAMPDSTSHSNETDHKSWAMDTAKSMATATGSFADGVGKAANIALDVIDVVGTVAALL